MSNRIKKLTLLTIVLALAYVLYSLTTSVLRTVALYADNNNPIENPVPAPSATGPLDTLGLVIAQNILLGGVVTNLYQGYASAEVARISRDYRHYGVRESLNCTLPQGTAIRAIEVNTGQFLKEFSAKGIPESRASSNEDSESVRYLALDDKPGHTFVTKKGLHRPVSVPSTPSRQPASLPYPCGYFNEKDSGSRIQAFLAAARSTSVGGHVTWEDPVSKETFLLEVKRVPGYSLTLAGEGTKASHFGTLFRSLTQELESNTRKAPQIFLNQAQLEENQAFFSLSLKRYAYDTQRTLSIAMDETEDKARFSLTISAGNEPELP